MGWVYGSESKEGSRGKSEGGSQEEDGCGEEKEKEKNIGVSLTTLRQGTRERSYSFKGCWRVLDHRIQVQRGCLQRQERVTTLQES